MASRETDPNVRHSIRFGNQSKEPYCLRVIEAEPAQRYLCLIALMVAPYALMSSVHTLAQKL